MPVPKSDFEELYPADFYEPAELLEPDRMYTVPEIARLLQGLEPGADLEPEAENVLLDWAVPWVLYNSEALVVGEPLETDGPGYYGLATDTREG